MARVHLPISGIACLVLWFVSGVSGSAVEQWGIY